MKSKSILTACLLLIAIPMPAFGESFADNWHQWRGPNATGVSTTANPPVKWSEDENVKWKVAIEGQGTSTPIIWGDKVFVLTAINTGVKDPSIPDPEDQPKTNFFDIKQPNAQHAFVVLCLDRNSGKEIWRQIATTKIPHQGAHNDNDFAPASPTTDGKHLYCWFGSAGLFCYDLQGNKIWEKKLGEVKVGSSLGEGAALLFCTRENWSSSATMQGKAPSRSSMPRRESYCGNGTETKAMLGPHHGSFNTVEKHRSSRLHRVLYAATTSILVTSFGNAVD